MNLRIIVIILFAIITWSPVSGQKAGKKVTISGIVTDINKNPVEGAIVLIDNNSTGIITNSKGFFRVKVKPAAQLVTILYTNGISGEAMIDGKTTINIILDGIPAAQTGKGAVDGTGTGEMVNTGYGTSEKQNISTPVSKLDMGNSKFASYTNIYEMLKGTLPGVHVSGNKVTIQGASSIMLSTDPMFMVDGMEVSSIDNISPSQVASIEVLKGPSAAIYGSKGANGVIMITLIGSGRDKK